MKRLLIAALTLTAVIALGIYVAQPKTPTAVPPPALAEPAGMPTPEPAPNYLPLTNKFVAAAEPSSPAPIEISTRALTNQANPRKASLVFQEAIAALVSPSTDYEQRQSIWKKLKNAGKLDQAITELEQHVANHPDSADSIAELGVGYYKKAGATDDIRESAIAAMKADQTLETALNLDPSNWEARSTKTAGMAKWPSELNKGKEVIDQFNLLLQQQETQPPQPQFARTYLKLGEQYQQAGRADYAAQVWQRGASLFPQDTDLKEKLTSR